MRTSLRRFGTLSLIGLIMAGFAPSASAFFPIGGFDEYGLLRLRTWPIKEFDTNNNGVIEQGEGLELYVETGKSGFTNEEAQEVRESFDVWQEVPTSYACFNIKGYFQDPLPVGTDAPDTRLTVSMYVSQEDANGESVVPDVLDYAVGGDVLGVTLTIFTISDVVVTSGTSVKSETYDKQEGATTEGSTDTGDGTTTGGDAYVISAGTIIDCDIVIGATAHRFGLNGELPLAELKGTLVHEIGHMLGLGHTPLNNLRGIQMEEGDPTALMLVESEEVFWMTDPSGNANFRGVTPTMFPIYFAVQSQDGSSRDGGGDLAPDDISGVSWLYPRGDQSNYFNINQEARTYARSVSGAASQPIVGGHIVAWADVDNDPNTPRIPLFDTLSGLFIPQENVNLTGRFSLLGLWKQLETPRGNGAVFNPSYSITMSAMNGTGLDRQAPPVATPIEFDSIQGSGGASATTRSDSDYATTFLSEVFHEVENIIDVSNKDAGTPLLWSFEANKVVSGDTGRTLDTILPNRKPMFGNKNDVCFLNMIGTGTTDTEPDGGTTEGEEKQMVVGASIFGGGNGPFGPNNIRAFRDHVLLATGAGTALVDLYYQAAPVLAQFMLNHGVVYSTVKYAVLGFYWTMEHAAMVTMILAASAIALWAMRRRQVARVISVLFLAFALVFVGGPIHARVNYLTTQQISERADAIETGIIKSVESKWDIRGRIFTEVVLEIQETVKSGLQAGSLVTFKVLGGRVEGYMMVASDMPTFTVGEKVLLYLRDVEGHGYTVYAGERGKLLVYEDGVTGKEYVKGIEAVSEVELKKDEKAIEGQDGDGKIELNAYLDYLRGIVDAQKKAQSK